MTSQTVVDCVLHWEMIGGGFNEYDKIGLRGKTTQAHLTICKIYSRSGGSIYFLIVVELRALLYWFARFNMADSLFFFPYQTVTASVGRQKMIISVFNLLFIIHKQTLYDYHFFQIHSFLMPFYSVIKFLWYDSSSFIQAKIFRSKGNPSN